MALDIPAHQLPIYAFELLVVIAGLTVWGVFQFAHGTAAWRLPCLPPWAIENSVFLVICLKVVLGSLVGAVAARGASGFLPKILQSDSVFMVMLSNLGLHLGAVGGALLGAKQAREHTSPDDTSLSKLPLRSPISTGQCVVAGVLTFLAAIACIGFVSFVWQLLLNALGVAVEKQELIDIFGKTREPAKLAVMSFIAVVVAPAAEELAFRAGLFRYFRTRLPRWVAFVAPALVFALLHLNLAVFAPLFALALVFSLAYERTGRILVSIIAHGLFNLNTIVLVLLHVNM